MFSLADELSGSCRSGSSQWRTQFSECFSSSFSSRRAAEKLWPKNKLNKLPQITLVLPIGTITKVKMETLSKHDTTCEPIFYCRVDIFTVIQAVGKPSPREFHRSKLLKTGVGERGHIRKFLGQRPSRIRYKKSIKVVSLGIVHIIIIRGKKNPCHAPKISCVAAWQK